MADVLVGQAVLKGDLRQQRESPGRARLAEDPRIGVRKRKEPLARGRIKAPARISRPHRLPSEALQSAPVEVMDHIAHRLRRTAKLISDLVGRLSLSTQTYNLCTTKHKTSLRAQCLIKDLLFVISEVSPKNGYLHTTTLQSFRLNVSNGLIITKYMP